MSLRCQTCIWTTLLLLTICRELQAATVYDLVLNTPNLSSFAAVINATSLPSILANSSQVFTLFAPTNSALQNAFLGGSFSCTTDYYYTSTCTSLGQLLAATDVSVIASNLVLNANLTYSQLTSGMQLQFRGMAVSSIAQGGNGAKYLGASPMLAGQISANNGQVIFLTSFPPGDQSQNASAVFSCALLENFGPFSDAERSALTGSTTTAVSSANVASLQSSYQAMRQVVDLPQGGITNPLAIAYDPTAMYRLARSAPPSVTDSESVLGPPAPVPSPVMEQIVISGANQSPLVAYTLETVSLNSLIPPSTSPAASIASLQTQAAQQQAPVMHIPGVGESGVLGNFSSVNTSNSWQYPILTNVSRPSSNTTLAFMSVMELASLYRQRLVSSVELVEIYTARLQRYDYVLEAVVTYTTDLAMEQARAADQLFAKNVYLGPLHGIPYGLKDIMAVSGYPTTWGAPEFRNQYINEDCNVFKRLTAAGAVLIAKLATGEMAYDDVWFDGKTKNPWNILQGSSGSSAGPTASVVAGTVPFSVGSETEGSLMSPASVCGSTSMRPSLGAVGRSWTMTLGDSLDKLGPICRSARDCAVIFDIIRGQEDLDPASRNAVLVDPFSLDISKMTVGYIAGSFTGGTEFLNSLKARGVNLVPFSLSYHLNAEDMIKTIMISETAAHFDYWQRSGQDNQNVRQDYWPPLLRSARLIPAVEYIQTQRARSILATQVLTSMKKAGIDAFIANSTTELASCNLVGLPTVSVPIGYTPVSINPGDPRQTPNTVGIFGWPNGESAILALAMAWQNATTYNLMQPPIDNVPASILSQCIPYSRCTLPDNGTAPVPAPAIEVVADTG